MWAVPIRHAVCDHGQATETSWLLVDFISNGRNDGVVIEMNAAPEGHALHRESTPRSARVRSSDGGRPVALIVSPDEGLRRALAEELAHPSLRVLEAGSAAGGLRVVEEGGIDTVLVHDGRYGDRDGIDLLAQMRTSRPEVRRVLVGMTSDGDVMCEAINRAAVGFVLPLPWDARAIARIRAEITGLRDGAEDAERSRERSEAGAGHGAYGIIGRSPAILGLIDLIERVASTDSPVLVTGETGTGKELVGHAIHQASHRAANVFSAINSAAVPETLLESELFGHRKGSFTGANANRKGLFEHASGGTVFLDELAEMSLSMQAKLLRFLQTGEIRPVGDEATRSVDVRLVSATNKDLPVEIATGRFREDLYYRLAVIPITVPPLRERLEDVPLLVDHFLRRAVARSGKAVVGFEDDAMDALQHHDWPGNVRELQNAVERGVALCRGDRIGLVDLPPRPSAPSGTQEDVEGIQSLQRLERRHILETLDRVGWNRKKAASLLQISTTTLWRRLKEFGIEGSGPGNASRPRITASR